MTLRHTCTACAGSCHGVRIRLVGDDAARATQHARELGIDNPIVDGTLRLVDGVCVFQGPDGLCRIHTAFGGHLKPTVCRQYPLVQLETESGPRIGIDPGCYTAVTSWKTGPEIGGGHGIGRRSTLDPAEVRAEAHILGCLEARPAVSTVAAVAAGVAPADTLPPGLGERILVHLRNPALRQLLAHDDAGPSARGALLPVLEHVMALDPRSPPPWPALTPEGEAWAVQCLQRLLYLRLVERVPVIAVTMLGVVGAVACGWYADSEEDFGRAMAGWVRAIRAPPFTRALLPSPAVLMWLATGREA